MKLVAISTIHGHQGDAMLAATLAAADVGQYVAASFLGLGAAGVAGGVVAMAWSVHTQQIRLAERLARREVTVPMDDAAAADAHAPNGNGTGNGNGRGQHAADGNGSPGHAGHVPSPGPAPPTAIEGPDSVLIGEQARYRVRRTAAQQVVSWAAGGGSVSQAADPSHPDDLLLVADRPGQLMVSVRLREGLTERRETKAVTAMEPAETASPPVTLRLFLQDWPLVVVSVLVVGFAAALAALGSLTATDFIALAVPLTALLCVVATTRTSGGKAAGPPDRPPTGR
jgi:hypothetical protein